MNTGRVQPTGHLHIDTCFPLNQPISRKQVVNIQQLLHTNPSMITNLTVRANRPDNSAYATYDGTKVGCIPDGIYCAKPMRTALDPVSCTRNSGAVVANWGTGKDMGPALNRGTGSGIDCKWVNPVTLDTTRLGESGIVQYRNILRAQVPKDIVHTPGAVQPDSPREIRLIQSAFAGPADLPGLPCTGRWCNWDDPSVHYLSVGAWTTGTNYTVVSRGGGGGGWSGSGCSRWLGGGRWGNSVQALPHCFSPLPPIPLPSLPADQGGPHLQHPCRRHLAPDLQRRPREVRHGPRGVPPHHLLRPTLPCGEPPTSASVAGRTWNWASARQQA